MSSEPAEGDVEQETLNSILTLAIGIFKLASTAAQNMGRIFLADLEYGNDLVGGIEVATRSRILRGKKLEESIGIPVH